MMGDEVGADSITTRTVVFTMKTHNRMAMEIVVVAVVVGMKDNNNKGEGTIVTHLNKGM